MQEPSAQLLHLSTVSDYSVPVLSLASHDDKARKTVLILPALGISARFYMPLARQLAGGDLNAVIMEQRGHGHSSLRASRQVDYGFRHWLQEDIPATVDWIKRHFGGELILLGHSLGGHLAACYAGMYPRQIAGLVLSACGSPWLHAFDVKQRIQLRILQSVSIVMGLGLGYYNGKLLGFGGKEAKGLMRDWRQMVSNNSYRAFGMSEDLNQGVKKYSGALLCLSYSNDVLAPPKSVQAVIDKFSNAQLQYELLDSAQLGCKADHVNWVRNPKLVCERIAERSV